MGRSQGGFGTKIHIAADALGNPLRFLLTKGQSHEMSQARDLVNGFHPHAVIGDKSYDAKDFIDSIKYWGIEPVIPPRSNRKEPRDYDEHRYKERHLVECFVNKIKHFRRIFSRFDKLAKRYMAFLHFVGALIWLR